MENTSFEKWAKAFEQNTKRHDRKVEMEEHLFNWEIQSGYDDYRFETAIMNGLPYRYKK